MKVLVIRDEEKFWRELHSCGYKWRDITWQEAERYYEGNVSIDTVERLLKPHELDVVEFEAEVNTFAAIGKEVVHYIPIPKQHIQEIVKGDDEVRVFVVKKKAEDEPSKD